MSKPPSAPTLTTERSLWDKGHTFVCGLDEAGRGCLAGPVIAAAVIMPKDVQLDGVNDSKRVGPQKRETLAKQIRRKAIAFAIGTCTPEEIDRLNILHAAMEAMRRAAHALSTAPDYLLVDGNRCFPEPPWPYQTLVGGDLRCHSIAAASILAKTERDRRMRSLHEQFPVYSWNTNVGYPTPEHYRALNQHGPTPHHRNSFRLA